MEFFFGASGFLSPEVEEVSLDGPELAELLLSSLEESSDEPVLESELPEAGVLLELVTMLPAGGTTTVTTPGRQMAGAGSTATRTASANATISTPKAGF